MNEILTVEEMKQRYPGEWVLVGEPRTNPPSLRVLAGCVLAHSIDRDEVYRQIPAHQPGALAIVNFVELLPNVAIVL